MKRLFAGFLVILMLSAMYACAEGIIPAPPSRAPQGRTMEQVGIDYFKSIGIDAAYTGCEESVYSFDLGQGRGAVVIVFSSEFLEWRLVNPDDALLGKWMEMRFAAALDDGIDLSDREAVEGDTLIDFEWYGDQAVRVALSAIESGRHTEQDALRVRLCENILGERLDVPGGYANGREFLERMVILSQDALPPADETLFSDDPVERLVMRAVMDYNNAMKASWQVDGEKWQVLCALHIFETEETGDTLTVWAQVRESQYALFGGKHVKEGSGGSIPTRLTFSRGASGGWTLTEYRQPGDGTEYWRSIQAMCMGHENLADRMVNPPFDTVNAALERNLASYLESTGLYQPEAQ